MLICGIDEAGRGPLAGPVTAAAVILTHTPECEPLYPILNDSKKLSVDRRAHAAQRIRSSSAIWAVGWANHLEIDRINILYASHLAMRRALSLLLTFAGASELPMEQISCIVDGSVVPELPLPVEAVVKADASVPEVMAASILAKEARDAWMIRYDQIDNRYGFAQHKGYPTTLHRERLALYGPGPIHRRSFKSRQISLFPYAP
jgi:ribonuclease HII